MIIRHLICGGTRDEDVMAALERKDGVQNRGMESLKAIKEGNCGSGK